MEITWRAARSPALAALGLDGVAFYAVTAAKLVRWYQRPYVETWGGEYAVWPLAAVGVLGAVAVAAPWPVLRRLALAAAGAVLACAALVQAAITADGFDTHPASRIVAGGYVAVAVALCLHAALARRPRRAAALGCAAASLAAIVPVWLAAELNHLWSPS